MADDFDAVFLECGHALNPYVGFGKCMECGKKCCSDCLTSWGGDLLCPRCFIKAFRG